MQDIQIMFVKLVLEKVFLQIMVRKYHSMKIFINSKVKLIVINIMVMNMYVIYKVLNVGLIFPDLEELLFKNYKILFDNVKYKIAILNSIPYSICLK